MSIRITIRILFWVTVLTLCPILVSAQNNKYKINDKLYPRYEKADKLRYTDEGLQLADSLYREAIRIGDKKAQCLAHCVPVHYYFNKKDRNLLWNAVEELCSVSRTNGYLQYYYWGYRMWIVYLANSDRTMEAMQEAEEVRSQAEKDRHPYGIYTTLCLMGDLYSVRDDDAIATEFYIKALEYQLEHMPEQDPTMICMSIARYYRQKNKRTEQDLQTASKYIEIGLANAKYERNRAKLMCEQAMVLHTGNKIEEFKKLYEQCEPLIIKYNLYSSTEQLRYRKEILDGDFEEALKIANTLPNKFDRHMGRYFVFKKWGKFSEALSEYEQGFLELNLLREKERRGDLAEMGAQFDNYRLLLNNTRLEAEASAMKEKATAAELDRVQAQMLADKKNAQLQQANDKLRLSKLEARYKAQKADLELQQERIKTERASKWTYGLGLALVGLTFIYTLVEWWRTRASARRLHAKNKELTEARDRALQSEKMKTAFIQNMSHEIRTPLNAIVGFSQLLTSSDMTSDVAEVQEFSRIISHNSNLLTTLVNDILTLSDLDSGNCKIRLSEVNVDVLCRTAITLAQNKAHPGVQTDFQSDVPATFLLSTDQSRISHVLDNMLSNACKFTQQGSITLTCSLAENPGYLTFAVADTGPGIPEDKREEIFERFTKLDAFQQGTGLGLSICAAIAGLLHGRIYVDPAYTQGARFVFILPLDNEQ